MKTKWIEITKVEIEKSKELVTVNKGENMVLSKPEGDFDEVDRRSDLFRCVNRESNRVMYPTFEDIRPLSKEC